MKREEVFERVEPPAGGLAALTGRLDARPRPLRFVVPVAAAIAIAAAIALILAGRRDAVDIAALARAHGDPGAIALGLATPEDAPVTIASEARATTALAAVPTSDRRVSFYWVSSTSWQP